MLNRRHLLQTSLIGGFATMTIGRLSLAHAAEAAKTYEVMHSDAEWQSLLSANQYQVLRHEGTERPFTSPLLHEKRTGDFACAGCDLPLFSSKTKYASGTG